MITDTHHIFAQQTFLILDLFQENLKRISRVAGQHFIGTAHDHEIGMEDTHEFRRVDEWSIVEILTSRLRAAGSILSTNIKSSSRGQQPSNLRPSAFRFHPLRTARR